MVSLKGKLLVASPRLCKENSFSQTVVWLMGHGRDGAMGLCLNRKSPPCNCPDCGGRIRSAYPVFLGGPVGCGNHMTMIHGIERLVGKKKMEIAPGIYWGTPRKLEKALRLPMDDWRFKVITGYSGWEPNQLEKELANSVWTVEEATPELILDTDPEELWHLLAPSTLPQFSDN
jgi:putative transcriptional regulator